MPYLRNKEIDSDYMQAYFLGVMHNFFSRCKICKANAIRGCFQNLDIFICLGDMRFSFVSVQKNHTVVQLRQLLHISKIFQELLYCINKLKIFKKIIFCYFSAFFMLISLRYPKKNFIKDKNMYILAIATHFYDISGLYMLHK